MKSLPKNLTRMIELCQKVFLENLKTNSASSFLRQYLKIRGISYTDFGKETRATTLEQLAKHIGSKDQEFKTRLAQLLTLELELINCCENAYRAHRLEQHELLGENEYQNIEIKQLSKKLFYVLTAHPTESRTKESVILSKNIQDVLTEIAPLEKKDLRLLRLTNKLETLIVHMMNAPIGKHKKPSVMDEADYIYENVLQKEIVEELINTYEQRPVYYRAWVGGDKDGHPGVNEKVMLESLTKSRAKIIEIFKEEIRSSQKVVALSTKKKEEVLYKNILRGFDHLKTLLSQMKYLGNGDGFRVDEFKRTVDVMAASYLKSFSCKSYHLTRLQKLISLFPGLVIPLEFREESTAIVDSLHSDEPTAIALMIDKLSELAKGGEPQWYVRGFVISQFEEIEHFTAALKLIQRYMRKVVPIIPLFESKTALLSSSQLVEDLVSRKTILDIVEKQWHHKFEVMVGYSDSAKEIGVFSSRTMIEDRVHKLTRLIKSKNLIPIIFHGSGGSVARGGGSVSEQVAWWPKESLKNMKMTIQGEIIQRTFSSLQIFKGQRDKFFAAPNNHWKPLLRNPSCKKFVGMVEEAYTSKVGSKEFMDLAERMTPYRYLHLLRLGSRPSKRKEGGLSLDSLRAIPWVMCWTQTRVFFPIWWGIGQSWQNLTTAEQTDLKKLHKNSPVFSSIVKLMGYTISKVEFNIWSYYVDHLLESHEDREKIKKIFSKELRLAKKFLSEVSDQKNLGLHRPWLKESIQLRSPLIDPLNILQVDAMKSNDDRLLREAVTGIACGLLTTG